LDAHKKGFDKIRWERMFTTVGGSGEPKSYLNYFLVFLALFFGYDTYRKRKRKNS
jgi:signal peptidase I